LISRFGIHVLICALGALTLPALAGAQELAVEGQDLINGVPRRQIQVARVDGGERIVLDGRLDEGVWKRAAPAKDFVQIDPQNGTPATEPTEVRIAISEDAFYMGVTAFDSEPDKWLGYQRRRDEFLPADDRFMWRIDTFLDERSGYFFEMNPSGLMADAVFGVNGMNRAWDGIWDARVRHDDRGWTIEIEIPFRTLNFDPNNETWGINFQRTVRRKNEDSIWMGWARNQGLDRMTNAGHVKGISGATQGKGLDIKPYGLLSTESSPSAGRRGWLRDEAAGVDLFYNPTPGLRANLTINTDFAQTEVDQRQVNLTRFSLFFPERRDFFLDGATFFDFASTSGNGQGSEQVQPFFSRRIGLSEDARPQRVDYGTKFTGQAGGQDVGPKTSPPRASNAGCCSSRTSAPSSPTASRTRVAGARARRSERTSVWPPAGSATTRTSTCQDGSCTRAGPTPAPAAAPTVSISTTPTTGGTAVSTRARFSRISTRRWDSSPAAITAATTSSSGSGRGRATAVSSAGCR
jgi:hypothetical protein